MGEGLRVPFGDKELGTMGRFGGMGSLSAGSVGISWRFERLGTGTTQGHGFRLSGCAP